MAGRRWSLRDSRLCVSSTGCLSSARRCSSAASGSSSRARATAQAAAPAEAAAPSIAPVASVKQIMDGIVAAGGDGGVRLGQHDRRRDRHTREDSRRPTQSGPPSAPAPRRSSSPRNLLVMGDRAVDRERLGQDVEGAWPTRACWCSRRPTPRTRGNTRGGRNAQRVVRHLSSTLFTGVRNVQECAATDS